MFQQHKCVQRQLSELICEDAAGGRYRWTMTRGLLLSITSQRAPFTASALINQRASFQINAINKQNII